MVSFPEGVVVAEFTEDTVLVRAVQGDQEAFSALYEQYVGRIYNYVLYRTGNPSDAEDITARVFHRALKHIERYQFQGVPFSAWLYRIAHNLVANWHRDNSRRQEVPLEDHVPWVGVGNHPEAALVDGQELEGLVRAIRTLSPERQHLIVLKFIEHLSNAEIAVIMGKSEGAIKSLYHRTLLALREVMENDEP